MEQNIANSYAYTHTQRLKDKESLIKHKQPQIYKWTIKEPKKILGTHPHTHTSLSFCPRVSEFNVSGARNPIRLWSNMSGTEPRCVCTYVHAHIHTILSTYVHLSDHFSSPGALAVKQAEDHRSAPNNQKWR